MSEVNEKITSKLSGSGKRDMLIALVQLALPAIVQPRDGDGELPADGSPHLRATCYIQHISESSVCPSHHAPGICCQNSESEHKGSRPIYQLRASTISL